MAIENWNSFNGWCRTNGIFPMEESVADFQDIVLHWLTDGLSEKGLMDLERQLTLPPPMTKVRKDDPIWSAEAEMAMFKKAQRPAR